MFIQTPKNHTFKPGNSGFLKDLTRNEAFNGAPVKVIQLLYGGEDVMFPGDTATYKADVGYVVQTADGQTMMIRLNQIARKLQNSAE